MKTTLAAMLLTLTATTTACKKGDGGGTGGGGGGWLVGTSGRMANVTPAGALGPGYDLGASEDLFAIACRGEGEAFVVGAHGTVLYTDDGGRAWTGLAVPTAADLHALATQDAGPVFVAGDGTLLRSRDAGATWTELSDGATRFVSLAAAQRGTTVLAVASDGALWSVEHDHLVRRGLVPGGERARAIAVSPDGLHVALIGDGVLRSEDGGVTFARIANADGQLESARIDDRGETVAVGAAGTVINISAGGVALRQHVGTADLHVVHMQTWGTGNALAKGYLAGEDGQVYLTTDAGWSWHAGPALGGPIYGADEIGAGHN